MEWLINMDRAALVRIGVWLLTGLVVVASFLVLTGMRYIPNNKVGIVEKLWSLHGHVREGRLMALPGQTGYQMAVLRGGMYFFFWRWLYRIHKQPLVPQHLFLAGTAAGTDGAREGVPQPGQGLLGTLISLLVAEKTGWPTSVRQSPGSPPGSPPGEKAGS